MTFIILDRAMNGPRVPLNHRFLYVSCRGQGSPENFEISKSARKPRVPWAWTLEETLKKPQNNKKGEETQGTLVQPRVFLRTRPYCTCKSFKILQGPSNAIHR